MESMTILLRSTREGLLEQGESGDLRRLTGKYLSFDLPLASQLCYEYSPPRVLK